MAIILHEECSCGCGGWLSAFSERFGCLLRALPSLRSLICRDVLLVCAILVLHLVDPGRLSQRRHSRSWSEPWRFCKLSAPRIIWTTLAFADSADYSNSKPSNTVSNLPRVQLAHHDFFVHLHFEEQQCCGTMQLVRFIHGMFFSSTSGCYRCGNPPSARTGLCFCSTSGNCPSSAT